MILCLFSIYGGDPWFTKKGAEFKFNGMRYKVTCKAVLSIVESPFNDGVREEMKYWTVENLTTGKSIKFTPLIPHLISRYGFYGGGTHRLEPKDIIAVMTGEEV